VACKSGLAGIFDTETGSQVTASSANMLFAFGPLAGLVVARSTLQRLEERNHVANLAWVQAKFRH
jgi:hypothetical protein